MTRHNVLFLLSLQIYQPFPGMVCFQNCNQSDIIIIVILIILNPLLLIHFLILLYTRTLDNGSISAHNRRRGCAGYTQLLTQQTLHFQLLDILLLVSFSTFEHPCFLQAKYLTPKDMSTRASSMLCVGFPNLYLTLII